MSTSITMVLPTAKRARRETDDDRFFWWWEEVEHKRRSEMFGQFVEQSDEDDAPLGPPPYGPEPPVSFV